MNDTDRQRLLDLLRAVIRKVNFHVLADVAVQGVAKEIASSFGISEDELLTDSVCACCGTVFVPVSETEACCSDVCRGALRDA